ncbi:hypothetical protein INT48_004762 [Thamnidium elegans]|uniref:Copper acquisition factor BIM1-like domain-containing protein n=1 Tax=Thamnidium elegans TaxID=101142 RepID=A0A8H7SJX0_9FUNG|nr:hypothetical protein INT48_004762 [Thamnidium elegans]
MLRPTLFLLLAGVLQIVSAHFELKYPTTRGFDETKEPTFPCGGFDTVQNRTQVPLKDAFVEINSGHTSYSYVVNVLAKNDPTTADFSTAVVAVSSGTRNYPQAACLSLNLSNGTGITNGSNATIQVIFNGGDGLLYQCTDVTFVDSAPNFDQSMCVNADGSSTATSSGSAPAANNTQSKASSVTVSSGFLLLVIACIYITV